MKFTINHTIFAEFNVCLNKLCRHLPSDERERLVNILLDMFECNFDHLPAQFFFNSFFWLINHHTTSAYTKCASKAGVSMQSWVQCRAIIDDICPQTSYRSSQHATLCYTAMQMATEKSNMDIPLLTPFVQYRQCVANVTNQMQHCRDILRLKCLNARLRVIKTIRLDMTTIGQALERYGNIKVLHLVRHPGAMMHSRIAVNVNEGPNTTICRRMCDDVTERQRLERIGYKNNFLLLRYEDVVKSFKTAAEAIFQFIDSQPPEHHLNWWIKRHTRNRRDNDNLGTIRKNPSEHIDKWQTSNHSIDIRNLLEFNNECQNVIRLLSY